MNIWADRIRPQDKLTEQEAKNALKACGCIEPFLKVEAVVPKRPDEPRSKLFKAIQYLIMQKKYTDIKYVVGPVASSNPQGKAQYSERAKLIIIVGGKKA